MEDFLLTTEVFYKSRAQAVEYALQLNRNSEETITPDELVASATTIFEFIGSADNA